MRRVVGCLTVACSCVAASASIATFDSLSEGIIGDAFTNGGIHFYNPDNYTVEGTTFVCERADATLSGPYFSAPNVLTMTGWVPGAQSAYSRIGSFYASTGSIADYASLEVFYFFLVDIGNVITLEGLRHGDVVISDSFTVTTPLQAHATLTLDGEYFDEIRLVGSGDYEAGAMFAVIDNVEIRPIPAPGALVPLALLSIRRRR